MMNQQHVNFLKQDFVFHLKHLAPDAQPAWGKMNGQQMVEHMAEMLQVASGRQQYPAVADKETTEKTYAWLMTDKPFRPNTVNPLLPEEPKPTQYNTMQQAIEALQKELDHFFEVFEKDPQLRVLNPVFGNLNFEEQVQLLYKHTQHHLKQFGLIS
ncbi:MAG: DinB family protein [Pseudobacter sp.]|uniref:DinB family protein n=1 Tax=Pseudobacter sp. TaxID=2045420 RepID=UPI003F7F90FC